MVNNIYRDRFEWLLNNKDEEDEVIGQEEDKYILPPFLEAMKEKMVYPSIVRRHKPFISTYSKKSNTQIPITEANIDLIEREWVHLRSTQDCGTVQTTKNIR